MLIYHPLTSRITASNNVPWRKPLKKGRKMKPSKYLEFRLYSQATKTQIWEVCSKTRGSYLGYIRWYGPWRQYAFHPGDLTVWNPECLKDVCEFIRELMEDHRKGRTK